jgi:hypothetical protein
MNQELRSELASAANPFATFIDPTACLEAHGRLARLPQCQYRPLDKPIILKGAEALAGSMEDDDEGVLTEMADLDDLSGVANISDIARISEVGLLNCRLG